MAWLAYFTFWHWTSHMFWFAYRRMTQLRLHQPVSSTLLLPTRTVTEAGQGLVTSHQCIVLCWRRGDYACNCLSMYIILITWNLCMKCLGLLLEFAKYQLQHVLWPRNFAVMSMNWYAVCQSLVYCGPCPVLQCYFHWHDFSVFSFLFKFILLVTCNVICSIGHTELVFLVLEILAQLTVTVF